MEYGNNRGYMPKIEGNGHHLEGSEYEDREDGNRYTYPPPPPTSVRT